MYIIEVCLLKYYFESHLIYKWRFYRQTIFNQLNIIVPYVDIFGLCLSVANLWEIYMMRPQCHVKSLRFHFKRMLITGLGQYTFSIIRLFTNAPHIVIALPSSLWQTLLLLISLPHFCMLITGLEDIWRLVYIWKSNIILCLLILIDVVLRRFFTIWILYTTVLKKFSQNLQKIIRFRFTPFYLFAQISFLRDFLTKH